MRLRARTISLSTGTLFHLLTGCATPSHNMVLPSTIRSDLLGTSLTAGSVPTPKPDTLHSENFETFHPGDENFFGGGVDLRLRLLDHVVLGAELSGSFPMAAQASGSLSIQPCKYLIGTGWGGVDFRSGQIGGVEVMAGNGMVSVGGGLVLVHPVFEVGNSWNGISPRWGNAEIPYSRIAIGIQGLEIGAQVGYDRRSGIPWMFQFGLSVHPLTMIADSIKNRWTSPDSGIHRGRAGD